MPTHTATLKLYSSSHRKISPPVMAQNVRKMRTMASVRLWKTMYKSREITKNTIGKMIFVRSFARQLEFIFIRPLIGAARGQLQLLAKHLARPVYPTSSS